MSLDAKLAEVIEWLYATEPPAAVEKKARELVLDTLGCVLAASRRLRLQNLAKHFAAADPGTVRVPGFGAPSGLLEEVVSLIGLLKLLMFPLASYAAICAETLSPGLKLPRRAHCWLVFGPLTAAWRRKLCVRSTPLTSGAVKLTTYPAKSFSPFGVQQS